MKEAIFTYDPAEALEGREGIAIFMADAYETGDTEHIARALGVVARAKEMAELAKETGTPERPLPS